MSAKSTGLAGGAAELVDEDDSDDSSWRTRVAMALIVLVVVGITVGGLVQSKVLDLASFWARLGPWWLDNGWPWLSNWLSSPGFGGFAAVIAAGLAFAGARHQARLNAWWQRVEWALSLYVKPAAEDLERRAGAAAIEALADSRLAKSDEKAFLAQVMEAVTLDPLGNGLDRDDWNEEEGNDDAEPATPSGAGSPALPSRARQLLDRCATLKSRRRGNKIQNNDGTEAPRDEV